MIFSGGVFYHLRALRYRKAYWDQHHNGVRKFLEEWNPASKKLLLVGPSAGYSLPSDWLARFDSIEAFEPDPVARMVFTRIHGIRPRWLGRRFPFQDFSPFGGGRFRDSAVLFCNILGQLEIRNVRAFRNRMRAAIEGTEWASYHDALSGAGIEFDLEDARPGRAGVEEMRKWIFTGHRASGEIFVNSHTAPEIFRDWEGLEFRYWQWRILPGFTHLIEGVSSGKGSR